MRDTDNYIHDWAQEVAKTRNAQERFDNVTAVAIITLILCGFSFIAGFYIGVIEPRDPTFSESVMKASEIARMKIDKRCEKAQVIK